MNYSIDIVLVSNASTPELEEITKKAVDSAQPHQVIVVESNPEISYQKAQTIHPQTPFNYNHYLNIGAQQGRGDYIFFGNNDLLFENGWDDEIIEAMQENNIRSASPYCPLTHEELGIEEDSGVYIGYEVYKIFCGWAFIWERSLYQELNKLDEALKFWCSDNVVVEQLKNRNEKHMLVSSSIVFHVKGGSRTLLGVDDELYEELTKKDLEKFNSLYKQNIAFDEAGHPKAKFFS